jgi:hypothetical protein
MGDGGIDLTHFNQQLAVGQMIEARWTACHGYFTGQAEVVRVNRTSVRVRLLHDVGDGAYAAGREVVLPLPFRSGANRWSFNNGAFPPPADTNRGTS